MNYSGILCITNNFYSPSQRKWKKDNSARQTNCHADKQANGYDYNTLAPSFWGLRLKRTTDMYMITVRNWKTK